MYYSSFGILAVILHIIINRDILKRGKNGDASSPDFRFREFLNTLLAFYITDLLWGFLVDLKWKYAAYADTMIFFALMALSVMLWTRYVVAFLDKKGFRAKAFLGGGWLIFGVAVLMLIVNFFDPIIFMFTRLLLSIR